MIRFTVWLTLPTGEVLRCGEVISLVAGDPSSGVTGAFRYDSAYLKDPRAFPLDPVALPLQDGEHKTSRPEGIHPVFEDALPDAWGRKLLAREFHLAWSERQPAVLLPLLGARGLGALSFSESGRMPPARPKTARSTSLDTLVRLAESFDRGEDLEDSAWLPLFAAGSSPGGGRPKVLVEDRAGSWIAKFHRTSDAFNVVRIEEATACLARQAGLPVPETRIVRAGTHEAFLIRRFDVTPAGGRRHTLSFQTLLGQDGWYRADYKDLARMLARHSACPKEDLPQLYRHMVFNVGIGNTDDHLKNFALQWHPDAGLRIAPPFDLLPDILGNREHVLGFGGAGLLPVRADLLRLAPAFGLQTLEADRILNEVMEALSGWETVFHKTGVPQDDRRRLLPGIASRSERLRQDQDPQEADDGGPRP